MAQDKAPAKAARMSFSEMFRRKPVPDEDALVLSLPSVLDGAAVPPPGKAGIDLAAQAKLWLLLGSGASGKSFLARWIGGRLAEAGRLEGTLLAALDPTNRTLCDFFEDVEQPPNANPARVTTWLRELLAFVASQRTAGIVDFGGNNTSIMQLVETSPGFSDPLDQAGVAPVAAYLLSPRVDDLTLLAGFEQRGFQPKATALILNLGRAETADDFDAVRRHPAYKAALGRGAVEVWLPKLEPQSLALEIERKRLHFFQARDGSMDQGRKAADISPLERVAVADWLRAMDASFAPVATWMPGAVP